MGKTKKEIAMTLAIIGGETTSAIPLDEPPHCDHCGEPIHGEPLTLPDGYSACDSDCAASLGYTQCHICGDWHDKNNSEHDPQGNPLCTECFEEHYCVCEICGETVPVDEIHWIQCQEKTVCETCRRDDYVRSNDCGQLVPGSDGYFVDGQDYYVCGSCRENNYTYCDRCGHLCHYDSMEGDICDECRGDDEDDRIHEYCYRPDYIFHQTNADTVEHKLYFGFELEIEVEDSIPEACDVVEKLAYLYMKSDSSISRGFEIVSHPETLNYWQQEQNAIAAMLQTLKALGCDAEPQG